MHSLSSYTFHAQNGLLRNSPFLCLQYMANKQSVVDPGNLHGVCVCALGGGGRGVHGEF